MVTSFYRIGGQPLIFSLQGDFSKDFSKDFSSRRFLRKEISLEEDISGRRFLFNKISQEEDFSGRRFLFKKISQEEDVATETLLGSRPGRSLLLHSSVCRQVPPFLSLYIRISGLVWINKVLGQNIILWIILTPLPPNILLTSGLSSCFWTVWSLPSLATSSSITARLSGLFQLTKLFNLDLICFVLPFDFFSFSLVLTTWNKYLWGICDVNKFYLFNIHWICINDEEGISVVLSFPWLGLRSLGD